MRKLFSENILDLEKTRKSQTLKTRTQMSQRKYIVSS